MNSEKNTVMETVQAPHGVEGFDPMKFAKETKGKSGEKVLTLDLAHKKAWFRLACPNGGLVLNALRVTDTMAIYEARVFADTGDSIPLASFTAAQPADKAAGQQYIRTAQEAALSEALDNAGFDIRLCGIAPAQPGARFTHVRPLGEGETVPKSAEAESSTQAADSSQPADAAKQTAPAQTAQKAPAPASDDKRPAPIGPPPHDTAPQLTRKKDGAPAAETAQQTAPPVVDIATGQPVTSGNEASKPQAAAEPPSAPAAAGEPAQTDAPAYTADMTVEEICRVMTLEQAKAVKVLDGTCKGWTLEQVAKDRPSSLKWLQSASTFADNVMKAAAKIVLDDLELKAAG